MYSSFSKFPLIFNDHFTNHHLVFLCSVIKKKLNFPEEVVKKLVCMSLCFFSLYFSLLLFPVVKDFDVRGINKFRFKKRIKVFIVEL